MKKLIPLAILLLLLCACDSAAPGDSAAPESPSTAPENTVLTEAEIKSALSGAWEQIDAATSLDYDLSMDTSLRLSGSSANVYTDGRVRFNGAGSDGFTASYSYSSTTETSDYSADIYYANGMIYENGYYGRFRAPATADRFYEFIEGNSVESSLPLSSYESLALTETGGERLITYGGSDDALFDYFCSLVEGSGIDFTRETFGFTGESLLNADGSLKRESSFFSCSGKSGQDAVKLELKLVCSFNSIDEVLSFNVPESDSGYSEISDIRIPGILFGAYEKLHMSDAAHVLRSEERRFAHGTTWTEFSEVNEIKLDAASLLTFSSVYSGELDGRAFSGGEYFDGRSYTEHYDGVATPYEDYSEQSMWEYISYYYTEYYLYPEYIQSYTLSETEHSYIIDYSYIKEFADWETDYYYYQLFAVDKLTDGSSDAEYKENGGRVVIDKLSGEITKHDISINALYLIDGTLIESDQSFTLEIKSLVDVKPDPAPSTGTGDML